MCCHPYIILSKHMFWLCWLISVSSNQPSADLRAEVCCRISQTTHNVL